MLKLDNNLLDELGLGGLPEEQKRAMLQHIYDTLELRVGTNLANQMTDQQLDEFERFIDSGGDANQTQALQWLETNLPNYKQVVNDVFEQLKGEIKQMAPQIMATSAPAQQPAPMPSMSAPAQQPAAQAIPPVQQPNPAPQAVPQTIPLSQPDNTSWPAPSEPPQPAPGQQEAQVYQFPTQQPPAGPGNYQNPQHPGGQQAA
jgi:hypothetical protein